MTTNNPNKDIKYKTIFDDAPNNSRPDNKQTNAPDKWEPKSQKRTENCLMEL